MQFAHWNTEKEIAVYFKVYRLFLTWCDKYECKARIDEKRLHMKTHSI